MKRFLLIFVLSFLVKFGYSQVYQVMAQYGYGPVKRFDVDSTLTIPTTCGVPTLRSTLTKKTAIAYDSCNNRFYIYNPKTLTWSQLSGGGGSTDTTSLSNRINLKLNIADTTNNWVNSVTKINDSTIRVIKGVSTTDITLTPSATVTSATRLITTAYNKTGSTILKGSVVYIDGAHSSVLPSIALAQANQESTSAYTYGLVETDISNNSSGTVIQSGNINNLNLPTSSYTDGQTLYLSSTVAGGYTTTKPLAPNHYVAIGTITRAHPTLGAIQIAIRNGFQLDEMSDVKIAAVPNDSTLLQFSRVDSLWHDVSVTNAIGTKYIKPSDTATMLTNYAKTSVVNLKVNISDTASMLTNYAKTSAVNLKLNTSDTATMLSTYQKSITAIKTSDTSVFQRKNIGAYSFLANKTSASANATNQTFKDTSGTYTGNASWTGTTPPSGTNNHSYRWTQIGKLVIVNISLVYGTAGSTLTAVTMDLPSDCPTPSAPAGISGNSRILYYGSGNMTANGQIGTNASRAGLIINSTSTGYSLTVVAAAGNYNWASITVQYYTN